MKSLNIRNAIETDLDRCFEIERTSYSGDEAASKEKIFKRIKTYPTGFVLIENDTEIIGFINSGATDNVELSNEDFKELIGHDSNGKYIVIMSVVVHPDYQGAGMINLLMNSFVNRMKSLGKSEIFLICQANLINMYKKYGFVQLGLSESNHGGLSWYEMSLSLKV